MPSFENPRNGFFPSALQRQQPPPDSYQEQTLFVNSNNVDRGNGASDGAGTRGITPSYYQFTYTVSAVLFFLLSSQASSSATLKLLRFKGRNKYIPKIKWVPRAHVGLSVVQLSRLWSESVVCAVVYQFVCHCRFVVAALVALIVQVVTFNIYSLYRIMHSLWHTHSSKENVVPLDFAGSELTRRKVKEAGRPCHTFPNRARRAVNAMNL